MNDTKGKKGNKKTKKIVPKEIPIIWVNII
jgi:hypothetical protein